MHAFDSENILFLFHLQTCTCLVSSVLDSGGVVGNLFLIIGLPIIAVAVLALFTVLVTIILLTFFYRRLVFIVVVVNICRAWGTFILNLSAHLQIMVYTSSHPLSGGDREANRRR